MAEKTLNLVTLREHDSNDEGLDKSEFGFYLKNMRDYCGLSRGAFSRLLGINQRTYYNYEVGECFPDEWMSIKQKVSRVIENKRKGRDLNYNLSGYQPELIEEITQLHLKGKNTVQIGIHCDLEENLVAKILHQEGYEPITYSFYD